MNDSPPPESVNPYQSPAVNLPVEEGVVLTSQDVDASTAKFYFWCLQFLPILFALLSLWRPSYAHKGLAAILYVSPWETILMEVIAAQSLLLALSLTIRRPTKAIASNMLLRLLLVAYLIGVQQGLQQLFIGSTTSSIDYEDLLRFAQDFGWAASSVAVLFVPHLLYGWTAKRLGAQLQVPISPGPMGILSLLMTVILLLIFSYYFVDNLIPVLHTVTLDLLITLPGSFLFCLVLCGIGCRLNRHTPFKHWAISLAFAIATSIVMSLPGWWYHETIPKNAVDRLVIVMQQSVFPIFLGASWYFLSRQGFQLGPATFPFASTSSTESLSASSGNTSETE